MLVQTNLRLVKESAAQLRYYPTSPLTATNVQDAIDQVAAATVDIPVLVTAAMSPFTPAADQQTLLVDTSGAAVTIALPPAATRVLPIKVIDGTGQAATNNIRVTFTGTANGFASPILIDAPFGGWAFHPRTNGNWYMGSI